MPRGFFCASLLPNYKKNVDTFKLNLKHVLILFVLIHAQLSNMRWDRWQRAWAFLIFCLGAPVPRVPSFNWVNVKLKGKLVSEIIPSVTTDLGIFL